MTPETETSSTSTGSNDGDGSDATTTCASETSESSSSNGGRGRGKGGCTGRGGHKRCGGRGRHFNRPAYISSIRNKSLRANFGTVLPSSSERIGGRPRIYHQVSNIKFTLDVHQGQYVCIGNWPYIKWLFITVMETRTIFFLRQGRDYPTEA